MQGVSENACAGVLPSTLVLRACAQKRACAEKRDGQTYIHVYTQIYIQTQNDNTAELDASRLQVLVLLTSGCNVWIHIIGQVERAYL